jgi:hypothetical protein
VKRLRERLPLLQKRNIIFRSVRTFKTIPFPLSLSLFFLSEDSHIILEAFLREGEREKTKKGEKGNEVNSDLFSAWHATTNLDFQGERTKKSFFQVVILTFLPVVENMVGVVFTFGNAWKVGKKRRVFFSSY